MSMISVFDLLIYILIKFSIFKNGRCFKEWKYDNYRGTYYRNPYIVKRACKMELGLSFVLLVLAIIEFCVALAASICSCQFACCGKEGCCQDSTKGKLRTVVKTGVRRILHD